MGSSIKTLNRLIALTDMGALAPGSAICDIGATQLFGDGAEDGARRFLAYYAGQTPQAKQPQDVADEQIRSIARGGFLGDLLMLAGFRYVALDIFHATNTILFDLNIHAPGPRLAGQFDMVTNFGTTEHVLNQLRAFQTIHELTRPGGVMFHDLPFAGYFDHAYFRYDPLFFRALVEANGYELLLKEISMGQPHRVPPEVAAIGYRERLVADVGIEMVVRRIALDPFKTAMETSTSLAVDGDLRNVTGSDSVVLPEGTTVTYGLALSEIGIRQLTGAWLRSFKRLVRRRVARALHG